MATEIPKPNDKPDDTATSTLRLNIGAQRFEFRFTSEVREVKNGPAKVIEMPATARPCDEAPQSRTDKPR